MATKWTELILFFIHKLWHSSRQKWQWTVRYLQWQPSVELQSDKQDSSHRPQDTSWSQNTSPHYMPLGRRYVNALIRFVEWTTSHPDRETTLRRQYLCSSYHITWQCAVFSLAPLTWDHSEIWACAMETHTQPSDPKCLFLPISGKTGGQKKPHLLK
jgi:hypothetical protein